MTIIVTGGAGFIGANFIRLWVSDSDEPIVNLDRLTYSGNPENLAALTGPGHHTLVRGDIRNRDLVSALLAEHKPRAIINFAAESHVDRSITGPAEFVDTNIGGAFNLLDCTVAYLRANPESASSFRFLQISTDEVYGSLSADEPPFSEARPFSPNSPYSASKAAADHLVNAYHHTFGLPTLVTHCSNNYGPFQFPEKLIPVVINNALNGEPIPIYGDGRNVRDWLHVDDHCHAIATVLARGRPGQRYNVGASEEISNIELARAICALLDQSPHMSDQPYVNLITSVADRPGHDRRYAIDAHKLRSELGWKPTRSFAAGLKSTVDWYLSNLEWVDRSLSRAADMAANERLRG